MTLAEYSTLLDWTGRQKRSDKRGKIPDDLQPILERIGIEGSMWCDLVWISPSTSGSVTLRASQ